ncbi:thymidylate synthase [symbiont of Argiope bruennichi]|uniref:thymidylate synthase n=1 Tax=symbiont of Argiope bruennichi TaxID=2810479 RepID=UPI003DA36FD1
MKQYLELCNKILISGEDFVDRTKTGCKSIFGYFMKFDLNQGFPLLTTKKMPFKTILRELLWFLKGNTNIKELIDKKVNIWNEWPYDHYLKSSNDQKKLSFEEFIFQIKNNSDFAQKWGDIGPLYGKQWRKWGKNNIDQLENIIKEIKKNPSSRRLLVSSWNVDELDEMLLYPCHVLFQFNVINGNIDLLLYQRSCDVFLGVPFNIASYCLLLLIVANICDLKPRNFIYSMGNCHIYNNHLEILKKQLKKLPFSLPQVKITKKFKNLDDIEETDFLLLNYNSHEKLVGEISV